MLQAVLNAQYDKTFAILAETIDAYADEIWYDDSYPHPAWRVAYHAIYFTNIYCSATEAAIEPWPGERENYYVLGTTPWPPHVRIDAPESYSRDEIRQFLDFVHARVPTYLEALDPDARCWPFWYDESQLEFHINNLRHLQHHAAELIERHDIRSGLEYEWR